MLQSPINLRRPSARFQSAANQSMSSRLLLIDDDSRLTGMLGDYLRASGFVVEVAGSLSNGRAQIGRAHV